MGMDILEKESKFNAISESIAVVGTAVNEVACWSYLAIACVVNSSFHSSLDQTKSVAGRPRLCENAKSNPLVKNRLAGALYSIIFRQAMVGTPLEPKGDEFSHSLGQERPVPVTSRFHESNRLTQAQKRQARRSGLVYRMLCVATLQDSASYAAP
jgi:hypothetical protein